MAVKKAEESKNAETKSNESKWAKWKRGGIIGAAAITGGALMAITGGMALQYIPMLTAQCIEISISSNFCN